MDMKNKICGHKGCNNKDIAYEPRFEYLFCEKHKNTPPSILAEKRWS